MGQQPRDRHNKEQVQRDVKYSDLTMRGRDRPSDPESDEEQRSFEKKVWIEHPTMGYAPGRVVHYINAQDVEVEAADGSRTTMNKSKCIPIHQNSLNGVPNLLELGEFSMAALLHNVRARYNRGEFYSSIGLPILLSVNPYKPMPGLYDTRTRQMYMAAKGNDVVSPSTGKSPLKLTSPAASGKFSRQSDGRSTPITPSNPIFQDQRLFIAHPHLFGTAQMTYSSLIRNNQAQSIVISGESGAGKTEATKILLRYFSEMDDSGQILSNFSATRKCSSPVKVTPKMDLRAVSSNSAVGLPDSAASGRNLSIELHTLRANPILEAFGNAKTIRNDNSSRFGKFIQIYFDLKDMKRVKSARISHYLLEKCRLVSIFPPERNFHIFYALLIGAQEDSHWRKILEKWQLNSPERFCSMLGDPQDWECGNEGEMFSELLSCLSTIGFTEQEIERLFSTIGALLHLSTVEFVPLDDPTISYTAGAALCTVNDIRPVELAAKLLLIDKLIVLGTPNRPQGTNKPASEGLLDTLLFKCVRNAEGRGSWIRSGRDVEQATQVRDGIIKEIYCRLFSWIVRRINKALCAKEETDRQGGMFGSSSSTLSGYRSSSFALTANSSAIRDIRKRGEALSKAVNRQSSAQGLLYQSSRECTPPIGLLDIYGFEVFEGRNSFEQLCINYANEKLQQHFNLHVLALEQKTYRAEDIDWSEIKFSDNKDIIRALEEPPFGVFVILDDTRVTDKNRDALFLQQVERVGLKDVVSLPPLKKFKSNIFIVRHYAGVVEYDCQGIVDKNQDKLEHQCCFYLSTATSNPLIQQLFPAEDFADISIRRNSLRATVSLEFRNQLDCLLASLTATSPTYVRCIKPNSLKQPNLFDSLEVLRQLEYAGLLESIKIRHSGFGIRCSFTEFLKDYSLLDSNHFKLWSQRRLDLSDKEVRNMCERILSQAVSTIDNLGSDSLDSKGKGLWQLGRTKVFMKEEVQIHLERCRGLVRSRNAVKIQAAIRGYWQRQRAIRKKCLVIYLQSLCRRKLAQRFVEKLRAAKTIQRFWKLTRPDRQRFLKKRQGVYTIQHFVRVFLARKHAAQLQEDVKPTHIALDKVHEDQDLSQGNTSGASVAYSQRMISDGFIETSAGDTMTFTTGDSSRGSGPVGPSQPWKMPHEDGVSRPRRIPSENTQPSSTITRHINPIRTVVSKSNIRTSKDKRRRRKSPIGQDHRAAPSGPRNNSISDLYEKEFLTTIRLLSQQLRKAEKNYSVARKENSVLEAQLEKRNQEIEDHKLTVEGLISEVQKRDCDLLAALKDRESKEWELKKANRTNQCLHEATLTMDSLLTDILNESEDRLRGPSCSRVADLVWFIQRTGSRGRNMLRRLDCLIQQSADGEAFDTPYAMGQFPMMGMVEDCLGPPMMSSGSNGPTGSDERYSVPYWIQPTPLNLPNSTTACCHHPTAVSGKLPNKLSPPSVCNYDHHLTSFESASSGYPLWGGSQHPRRHVSSCNMNPGDYHRPLMTERTASYADFPPDRMYFEHSPDSYALTRTAPRHSYTGSMTCESEGFLGPSTSFARRDPRREVLELHSVSSLRGGLNQFPLWRGPDSSGRLSSIKGDDTVRSSSTTHHDRVVSLNMEGSAPEAYSSVFERTNSHLVNNFGQNIGSGVIKRTDKPPLNAVQQRSQGSRLKSGVGRNSKLRQQSSVDDNQSRNMSTSPPPDPYLLMGGKHLTNGTRGLVVRPGGFHGSAVVKDGSDWSRGSTSSALTEISEEDVGSRRTLTAIRTSGNQTMNLYRRS